MLKFIAIGAIALIGLTRSGLAQTPPSIPSQYADAYNNMNASLASFDTTVKAAWNGSPSPVSYSAQLLSANSALTSNLLGANYYSYTVLSELNDLQALGVKSITFHLDFPTLLPSYYSNPADYQGYLSFYTTLVAEIRSRGLKVIIENTTGSAYPGTNAASFIPYFQSLDWPTYMSQRAQLAANIAKLLQPDYMVLTAEPDTEANGTGQVNAGTVSGNTQMVQGMIAAVRGAGVSNVHLGAGCGTWHPSYIQFVQSFTTLPLDFIDMHVYPVNKNNLPNALTAVGMIQAAGKQASMSEMWAYKESDAEYSQGLSYTTIYARDVYSFWGPTDIAFLQTMSDFANYGKFVFITPFWSHYLAAYLDYNSYGGQPDASLITTSATASSQANSIGAFTATGLAWENMAIAAPDKTPPLVPAAPALKGVSQTAATLVWTPTTDNVGVAAYNIYRNGALAGVVNTPLTYYDLALSPGTSYSYTVAAFDAAGNLSPQSSPLSVNTVAPPDTTPPSVPAGFNATPVSDLQMNLSWKASVDNVAVKGYEIYRGTAASSVVPYSSGPATSFTDTATIPSKTYYYQVDAYDAVGNHSARSAIVTATTLPDTTPPTVPGSVSVAAQSGPLATVSWGASTDDYMVGSYQIYRGTSPTGLQLVGGVAAPTVTFTDPHVVSGKTYYYAVAALDVARNISALSPAVLVSIP